MKFDRINTMKIAMNIAGLNADMQLADLLCRLNDAVIERKGDLTVDEVTSIQWSVTEDHKEPQKNEA